MQKIYYILLISIAVIGFKTPDNIPLLRFDTEAECVRVDNLGNIYTLKNTELKKFDSTGILLKTYSNKAFGNIDYIDLSNPLKILLFYKNFSQLVFLDNMLSETRSPISLIDIDIKQATLTCTSHNNGIWIYNSLNKELNWVDQNLEIKQRTGNISRALQININPNYLIEQNNTLYLNDPEIGILIFDNFGTYYKTIPIKGLKEFQVVNNKLFYLDQSYLKSFGIKTLQIDSLALPDTVVRMAQIENNRLYLLSHKQISVYKID
jgi:hypothetical protein